jgi:hypothetical protein
MGGVRRMGLVWIPSFVVVSPVSFGRRRPITYHTSIRGEKTGTQQQQLTHYSSWTGNFRRLVSQLAMSVSFFLRPFPNCRPSCRHFVRMKREKRKKQYALLEALLLLLHLPLCVRWDESRWWYETRPDHTHTHTYTHTYIHIAHRTSHTNHISAPVPGQCNRQSSRAVEATNIPGLK